MASSPRRSTPRKTKRVAVPTAVAPPPTAPPEPPAQPSQRRSPWKAVAIVAVALAVLAAVGAAGAVVGYSYGRLGGFVALRGNFPTCGFTMPYAGRMQPYDSFGWMPHQRLGPLSTGTAYLGITFSPVDAARAEEEGLGLNEGAEVSQVIEGGPAADAGLEPGDILLAVDGQRLTDAALLRRLIRMHVPGDEVTLLVLRAGEETTIKVSLGQAPDSPRP